MSDSSDLTSLTLLSPAKLNLMLHITGQRADGYHQLQTLFQLLDYGDTLHFQLRDDDRIVIYPSLKGVADNDNLIVKAARLLKNQRHSQPIEPLGVDIRLEKVLPMGGGLGGGSSDAATALLALNKLWKLDFDIEQLARFGLQLGADIPLFVHGHSAWAEGIGEQLQAIEIEPRWYIVLKPQCQVSTSEIFSHKQLTRDSSPITMAAVFEHSCRNDCEKVVRELYPEVDFALTWLSDRIGTDASHPKHTARLTGTGACVFADFPDEQSAQQILDKLPKELQGFVARGVNTSPTHKALNL